MTPSAASVHGTALLGVKAAHTAIWFGVEACLVYLIYAGLTGRTDRRAALAGAVVGGESLVFLANGARCPLTGLAQSLGAERGSVTDIYLPRWFAHNLPATHVPLPAEEARPRRGGRHRGLTVPAKRDLWPSSLGRSAT